MLGADALPAPVTGTGSGASKACSAFLSDWRAKRALGVPGATRLTVVENTGKHLFAYTWEYATRSTVKALLLKSVDFRFPTGKTAREDIAVELCHFKVACGAQLRAFKTAENGSRAFKELAKAFLSHGSARNLVIGSGSPAFIATGGGPTSGTAYALRDGWLDVIACVDTKTYKIEGDCCITALQLVDS